MTNQLRCLSSLQSGHQKGTQRFEKRDPWWRHIHAPRIAEGKPSLCWAFFNVILTLESNDQNQSSLNFWFKCETFSNNLTMKLSSDLKANEQIHQENFGKNQITHLYKNRLLSYQSR